MAISVAERSNELTKELRRVLRKNNIPGASVAVLRGKRIIARAAGGVINTETRVPVTIDTIFQIGSITKPMTATMIMQLRDEGQLDLDEKALTYLPNFRIRDMRRLRAVTVRHLMTHTSGTDGDFFVDTDIGDRAIEQFLDKCAMLPSLFEPGTNQSYSNVSFAMLGRIIEIMDNRSWDESLRARIFEPLGMDLATSLPQDYFRFRAAIGHLPNPKGRTPVVPERPFLNFGQKSAGSTPAMTAENLLYFAAAHMHDGVGLNGKRVLSARSTREMRRVQFRQAQSKNAFGLRFGLAWARHQADGFSTFSHDGGTVGQHAQLVVAPRETVAVAALTNGPHAAALFSSVVVGLLRSQARIKYIPVAEPRDIRLKKAELVGKYENIVTIAEVTESDSGCTLIVSPGGQAIEDYPSQSHALVFRRPRVATYADGMAQFGGPRNQPAQWLRLGSRLLNRVEWRPG